MQEVWGHVGLHPESRKNTEIRKYLAVLDPSKVSLRGYCVNQRRQSLVVGLEDTGDARAIEHPQEKLQSCPGSRP